MKRDAFKDFYEVEQSPANAVRLALSDHRMVNRESHGSYEFERALQKAAAQSEAHDKLVTALRERTEMACAFVCDHATQRHSEKCKAARALLVEVTS
jgi:hypothetical protein